MRHKDHFPHFTSEEPEALKTQWFAPGHMAEREIEPGLKPLPLALILLLLTTPKARQCGEQNKSGTGKHRTLVPAQWVYLTI